MAGRISDEAKKFAGCAAGERMTAPKTLTKAEAVVWDNVTMEKPAEWFTRDNVELLKLYCRASIQLDWVQDRLAFCKQAIEAAETAGEDGLGDLDSLGTALMNMTRFQAIEFKASQTLMNVATKLRMTPQAQINPSATATKVKASAPKTWETAESAEDLYAELPEGGSVN